VRYLFVKLVQIRICLLLAETLAWYVSGYGWDYLAAVENYRAIGAHPLSALSDAQWDVLCCQQAPTLAATRGSSSAVRADAGGCSSSDARRYADAGGWSGQTVCEGSRDGGDNVDEFPYSVRHPIFARTDEEYAEIVDSLGSGAQALGSPAPTGSLGLDKAKMKLEGGLPADLLGNSHEQELGRACHRTRCFERGIGPSADVAVHKLRMDQEQGILAKGGMTLPTWALEHVPLSAWEWLRQIQLLRRHWQLYSAVVCRGPLVRVMWSRLQRWLWLRSLEQVPPKRN
jgi:hypothetical protein